MLIPLSWLKEYVDIKLPLKELMWKMTEAGLTCEASKKISGDTILDVEVTPNRPDWMSVEGVAREIAAITGSKFKGLEPKILVKKPKNPLPIKIKPNFQVVPRITSVVIQNVSVKPSPNWLQVRIRQIGLRPINNLVDITNYVLWSHGSLLHVFDYDKILGKQMNVGLSKGGEQFRSLDAIDYVLPQNAIIIKDSERIIDLIPLKGGENTATFGETKNVLLHSIICDPAITRRTSQSLKLRSDSSAIAERGLDPNGTTKVLLHALSLILELGGGEIASDIIDYKAKKFLPWKLNLNLMRLAKVLGLEIPTTKVVDILARLGLGPVVKKDNVICTIPTFRSDLKLEEDLIEEVARIYGYNKFPRTLPKTGPYKGKIPYFKDNKHVLQIKEILVAGGYSEAMSLSLISNSTIERSNLNSLEHIKIANPVSNEFEYLRTSLIPSLLNAVRLNIAIDNVKLFELDKTFLGPLGKTKEPYKLAAVACNLTFREFKGIIDLILERFHIPNPQIDFEAPVTYWHPSKTATVKLGSSVLGYFGEIRPDVATSFGLKHNILAFEFDVEVLKENIKIAKFEQVPNYPAQIEDLTIEFSSKTKIGNIISEIKNTNSFINKVELKDIYNDAYTFRIYYLSEKRTLTDSDVKEVRDKVIKNLKKKFGATFK